jgi:putative adenylate-forming enzyme
VTGTPGIDRLMLLGAFWRALRCPWRDRDALLAWQQQRLRDFSSGPLLAAPFYRSLPDSPLTSLPPMDKVAMRTHFDGCNTAGVSLAAARDVAERAERERDFRPTLGRDISVGLSSGTSGQPAVFLVSRRERSLWAGTMLGRVLPPALRRRLLNPFAKPLEVAFFLRANSNLYTSVASRRVRFVFSDLLQPFASHVARLQQTPPDVLVAPASVLRTLAEGVAKGELRLRPQQILSVAEVLEPDDEAAITAAFGRKPWQVYQATEGLLGLPCSAGALHLHEEAVHFELEWLDAARTRAVPRLTDFTRHLQIFARYRLDDVLRFDPAPCPCGRPTLRLAAIDGRCDDVLRLPDAAGAWQPVFPDVLRRLFALVSGLRDYRLTQNGNTWLLAVQAAEPAMALAATRRELAHLCALQGWRAPQLQLAPWPAEAAAAKRRRIRCLGAHRDSGAST